MTAISAKYDQLIADLRQNYRPQREWGEGRGVFLVVGHFLVGVAAGAWLFGLLFAYTPGLFAAFFLAGAGGIAHLLFLGKPERFWRMALHVRTAWISRGFIGLTLFLVGAVLYLPPLAFPGLLWSAAGAVAWLGWLMAAVGMLVMMGYMGFVYSASKGVPFWNSPLHPVLYVSYALRGGVAALLVEMALMGAPNDSIVDMLLKIWMAITALVIVLFILELHGATVGGNAAARQSVRELLAGRLAAIFYSGTLLLGIVLPAILATGRIAALDLLAIAAVGLLSVLGDFFIKYTTIKAGIYVPLRLPTRSHA